MAFSRAFSLARRPFLGRSGIYAANTETRERATRDSFVRQSGVAAEGAIASGMCWSRSRLPPLANSGMHCLLYTSELFGADGWELAWAYGDHHSDRAMLAAAKSAYAVTPDRCV